MHRTYGYNLEVNKINNYESSSWVKTQGIKNTLKILLGTACSPQRELLSDFQC